MIKLNCITLPVDDFARSLSFYRDWLRLPEESVTPGEDHCAFQFPGGLYLVIIKRDEFAQVAAPAGLKATPGATSAIVSYFAASPADVDSAVARAETSGGTATKPAQMPWGYTGYVQDPDGHLWEVMFNAELAA